MRSLGGVLAQDAGVFITDTTGRRRRGLMGFGEPHPVLAGLHHDYRLLMREAMTCGPDLYQYGRLLGRLAAARALDTQIDVE